MLVLVAMVAAGILVHGLTSAVTYRYVYPYWDMVGLQWHYLHGAAWDFWVLADNEHLPIFAMPIFWLDDALFHARGEMLQALILLAAACFAAVTGRQAARAAGSGAAAAAAGWMVAALSFWLENWENLVFPKQVHMYLALSTFVAASVLVARPGRSPAARVAGVAALLTVSTFSFAFGVAGWIAVLCVATARRWPRRALLALLGVFALCLGIYAALYNRETVGLYGSPLAALSRPGLVLMYVWTYLATPLVYLLDGVVDRAGSVPAGRLLVLPLLAWLATRLWPLRLRAPTETETWAWLLILFTCGTALLSAAGRAHAFGSLQPLSTRYMPEEVPFWIGATLLALEAGARRVQLRRLALAGVGAVVMAAMVASQARALEVLRFFSAAHHQAVLSLVDGVVDRAQLENNLFPDFTLPVRLDQDLRARGWSVWSWPEPHWIGRPVGEVFASSVSETCAGFVDTSRPVTPGPGSLVDGWAFDTARGEPPTWVVLADAGGVIRGLARTGRHRPDVGAALRESGADYSGWTGYVPAGAGGLRAYAVLDHERDACPLSAPR